MDDLHLPGIFDAQAIREAVPLDLAAVAAVEAAFVRVARGAVAIPPVQQIVLPEAGGSVCIKSATDAESPFFVVKAASLFPGNAAHGLPNASGMMILFDARTGRPGAILLDDGHLTAIRTGAAGAIAARWLARPDSRRLTIVGTGHQAEIQAKAACLVRDIREIAIWGRDAAAGLALAGRLAVSTGADCRFEPDLATACLRSDIVVTTTASRAPLLARRHVAAGAHVTAVGADAAGKSELATDLLDAAALYACDSVAQCTTTGEYAAACVRGHAPHIVPSELAGIVAAGGTRRTADAITVADLTGTGAQDLAVAMLAFERLAGGASQASAAGNEAGR